MILGTAGHIDHGKTTLVQALTGIHTDRLQEEKLRGITIELGFAHLDLADGERLGVVDVPGHERFVRHMVAGAGGIDVVMMIVAADEGVMPQTREHLEICSLMGVERGFVVLTKTDLVDEEWRALVEDDLEGELRGTFLEGAPIVGFSAHDPEPGVADVRRAIEACVADARAARAKANRRLQVPRLPVDRVFTVHGFGTVVTGTLLGGRFAVGDEVAILPGDGRTRIRGLQNHGAEVDRVEPGSRVAVNLAGVARDELHRGQVLAPPGRVEDTLCFDASLEVLAHVERGVVDRAPVLLHTLTQQVTARVVVLDGDVVASDDAGFVQLRVDEPVAVVSGDRFVLRGFENVRQHGRTIAGGVVLDARAPRFRQRHRDAHLARLAALASGDPERALEARADDAELAGVTLEDLVLTVPFAPERTHEAYDALFDAGRLRKLAGTSRVFSARALAGAQETMAARLAAHHDAHPEEPGLDKEALRAALGGPDPRIFAALLDAAEADGTIARHQELVRAASFVPRQDDELDDAILAAFARAGLAGFRVQDADLGGLDRSPKELDAAARRLLESKTLTRVKPDYLVRTDDLDQLRQALQAFFAANDALAIGDLRDISGLSRKHLIPLVEYLDRRGWTRREGDVRTRGPAL